MMNEVFYRINEPHVISEFIDSEEIILNFDSGTYYSLNQIGGVIWQHIRAGYSQEDISTQLKQLYNADEAIINSDLIELVKFLETEALIVPSVANKMINEIHIHHSVAIYEKPSLEKFTDLQNLLLLDPIHDVDAMGWPHQAA